MSDCSNVFDGGLKKHCSKHLIGHSANQTALETACSPADKIAAAFSSKLAEWTAILGEETANELGMEVLSGIKNGLEELATQFEKRDAVAAKAVTHRIKGLSLNFEDNAGLCEGLENDLASEDWVAAEAKYLSIRLAYESFAEIRQG